MLRHRDVHGPRGRRDGRGVREPRPADVGSARAGVAPDRAQGARGNTRVPRLRADAGDHAGSPRPAPGWGRVTMLAAREPCDCSLRSPSAWPPRRRPPDRKLMAVKTTVTELPDSRVRLDAEVPSEEIESRLQRTATAARPRAAASRASARARCRGPMVIQRMGREAVLEQAVRDSLPEWYEEAIVRSGVSTVGDPKLDLDRPAVRGRAAQLLDRGRRSTPRATLGDYKEPRGRQARARGARGGGRRQSSTGCVSPSRGSTASTAPAEQGDHLVMDFVGQRRRRAVRGRRGARLHARARRRAADRGLRGAARRGASAGEQRAVEVDFPDEYQAEELQGRARRVRRRRSRT